MRIAPYPRALLAALSLLGCSGQAWPRPDPVPYDQFLADFEKWREDRRTRLVAPGSGAVTWVGLWDLNEGPQSLGADSTMPIVLPSSQSPRFAGTIHRSGSQIAFEPAPMARVQLVDSTTSTPVRARLALASDRSGTPTVLAVGKLRFRVHGEPGTDRLWLRAWDAEHPARQSFQLPESYPLDTVWRVSARLDRFDAPRIFTVGDVMEGTQGYRSPGTLVFRVDGREHRLVAFADTNSTSFLIMLRDSTAATTTYPAGRYVRAALPDSTGWTVIDFNRTYNPPCVFTPYSTCAFAPPENRLSLALTAGEKRLR